MKKILVWVIIVSVAVAGVLYDVSSKKTFVASNQLYNLVKIEDIESANLIPSHAGAGAFSLPLRMDDSNAKEVVTQILGWLNSSNIVGEAKNVFVSHGGNPTELTINLHNGNSILIVDAFDGVSSKLDNGNTLVQSMPVKDQITLVQSGTKAIRLKSPELKDWIQNGWSKEDVFKFTHTDAITKVLTKQPEFPDTTDQVKTMYEEVGGVEGSKVEVELTTKVEQLGNMEYVVTMTKNYQSTVGDKQVVTFWKYHVSPSEVTLIDSEDELPAIK